MEAEKELETRNERPETNRRRVWLTHYLPLFLWIGVIFYLSSSEGSMTRTSRFIRPLLELLLPTATEETLLFYHGIIRKFAHFAEYAVLGFLGLRTFLRHGIRGIGWPIAAAVGLAAAVALTDEFQQSFNPTRTGSIYDVVLDMSGALFAIIFYSSLLRRYAPARP